MTPHKTETNATDKKGKYSGSHMRKNSGHRVNGILSIVPHGEATLLKLEFIEKNPGWNAAARDVQMLTNPTMPSQHKHMHYE